MIPGQQKLAKRLADKPFAILGINSDGMSRSALKERLNEDKVTWPQLVEGTQRAVSQKWNVAAFPTLYVIDGAGVIRARGLHTEDEVVKVVDKLLAEMLTSN